nr:EOG090X0BI6 [Cyclestheria hislopi]
MFACLSNLESEGSLRQQVESALELYNKSVRQCLCLIDGQLRPDSELLDAPAEKESGKKKSKQTSTEERLKTWNIQILIPEPEMKVEKQKCITELRFGGQMCIKGYVHNKATVGEACQIVKEDIIRSLWARCDMHCDSLIGEEQRGQPDVRPVLHEPPRRVLAPLPYSPISVSDYLFPGEGPADSLISLADLLDLGGLLEGDIQDYWEAAAEINEILEAEDGETISTVQNATQTTSSNSRFILLSAIIALLAILLSYLTLHALRTT